MGLIVSQTYIVNVVIYNHVSHNRLYNMKLSTWAKKIGISYSAAWKMYKLGRIPNAYQLESGTIIVEDRLVKPEYTVTYARVSSSENKDNLVRQSKRLNKFCRANGWVVTQSITEVGSGLNDKRRKLTKVLEEAKVTRLVVEHKDRLSRFGVNYIRILCQHIGCELVIINTTEVEKDDLIQDFVAVITSFCARLYGLRRKSRKALDLIQEIRDEK